MEEVNIEAPEPSKATPVVPKKRGRGRPPKSDLQAVKDRTKGKLGRPKGDAGRIQEFKERLLATGGNRIIDKVVAIAMQDDHPGQMAALKLCMDRVLPVSLFEAAKNAGQTPTINISISSLGAPPQAIDVTDAEFRTVDEAE